jgi:hypothetical protein
MMPRQPIVRCVWERYPSRDRGDRAVARHCSLSTAGPAGRLHTVSLTGFERTVAPAGVASLLLFGIKGVKLVIRVTKASPPRTRGGYCLRTPERGAAMNGNICPRVLAGWRQDVADELRVDNHAVATAETAESEGHQVH